jgi:hypothetical protein
MMENDAGILEGMGRTDYDRVTQQITPDGVMVSQLSCRACGRKKNLLISYEELFYVANNGPGKPLILPDGWARSETNMSLYVQLQCGKCENGVYAVHFTPEDAQNLLRQAEQAQYINRPMVLQWAQKINQYAGARQG